MQGFVITILFLNILLMALLAIRIIRMEGVNLIFQYTLVAALATAALGFMELQLFQTSSVEVVKSIDGLYSIVAMLSISSCIASVLAFVDPFQGTRFNWLKKYQFLLCALPLTFVAFQFSINQVDLGKSIILKDGLWTYSLDYSSLTAKIYLGYCIIGELIIAYCFWIKRSSIIRKPGMLDKKIFMLGMTAIPIAMIYYFLSYSIHQQVPFLASLPFGLCVATLYWTYSDFSIFQINSKVAREEILDAMSNSMVITDLNYNIVEINPEAKKLMQKEDEILIGKTIFDLIKKGNIDNWKILCRAILNNKSEKHSGEFTIIKNGQPHFYHLAVNPVYNKTKHKIGFLFLALDLTKEKQKEKAILSRTRELQKTNLELERFAYIASHDLKTPLRNVVSFLDLIERKVVKYNDKELKEFTYHARQGASHMHHLIQDVLEYSRVNNAIKENKQVDLNDTLMKICINLQPQLIEKNAKVFVANLPVVQGEQNHMTQLFSNLIENGIKYNNNSSPSIKINHRSDNGQHVFAISDNGIGIEEKYYNQIFQMFKRLHTNSNYEGTGIGLSICKKIIDLYQGEIWLESKPSEGSVFFFTLSMN